VIDFRRLRPLDIALWAVAALVLVVGAYLGWSVWSHNRSVVESTPASRAVTDIKANLKKDPNNIDLRMGLAQALVVAGRKNEAVDHYKAILKAKKEYTPALSGLGFIAMTNKDWKTGEGYFRKVTELLAGTPNADRNKSLEIAYFYLGTALMEQHKYEDAVGYFKAALRIRRDASDTHYALAYCYKQMDSPRKYREELEATLAFDPKMPEANYDIALLLLKEGDPGRAAEHLRTSIDNAPNVEMPETELDKLGPFSKRFAAAKSLASAETTKALTEARVAVALEPKNVDALRLLASLWEKSGDADSATGIYQRILVIVPGDPSATKALERLANAS
jgi:tetratricopeptide (TPR) repeat protein